MPLFFQVLASGSKGNAILAGTDSTCILLDAGLSGKEIERRLAESPVSPKDVQALVVSHEHNDHVRGIGVLSRRYDLPVFLTRGSLEALPSSVGELAHRNLIQSGRSFAIGDLVIHPFALSHDAADPVGFILEHGGLRLGVCTDCGTATQLVRARLQHCHALVLEANHDTDRLIQGPYPWHLKQRIRSRHGHLSNEDSCQLLEQIHHPGLQVVVLAHLSEVNNHPDLVKETLRNRLLPAILDTTRFEVAMQNEPSAVWHIHTTGGDHGTVTEGLSPAH